MLEGKLQAAQMQPYLLEASAGQIMTASLVGEGVTMNLLRSNQEAVDAAAYQTRNWTGQLPVSERYLIQVAGSGNYTLELAITPQVSSMGAPLQRISFARGSHGTTVTGSLTPTQTRRYLIKAQAGQILALKVLEGRVSFSTIAPSGQRIGGSATNSNQWQGRLPTSGDYIVEITTRQPDDYALLLEVF